MLRLLVAALSAAVLGMGVAVVTGAGAVGADDTTTAATTTETVTTTTAEDNPARAGRDDNAHRRHRGHKRTRTRTHHRGGRTAGVASRSREAGEDVRGPCDEAEHAGDPRCAGAGAGTVVRDDDAAEGEDRSGPSDSSGPGSGDEADDEDHSGPGGGADDGADDHGDDDHGGDDD